MRRVIFIAALVGLFTCQSRQLNRPPPTNFYFPSGILHQAGKVGSAGFLYVVNANFDRRYDTGLLMAIDLDAVRDAEGGGLPAFGAPVPSTGPAQLTALNIASVATQTVALANFGGDLGVQTLPNGTLRMF